MDGPPPQEEDFTVIPIADRLAHKNWKARVSAYESLIKTFQTTASDTDPAFKPYLNNQELLKKIATDSNAVAQEKGVECLASLVKFAGETAAKTREAVVPALVEKCFGSTRAGTRQQAIELALQYVEVENGGVGVVTDILPGLSAKQPKAVAGCVTALKEIIRLFGTQTTPTPPVLKALPKIFAHNDKTVRAEGTLLALALYQYIGPGIDSWLADLKPVQVKELKEAFEGLEKDGKGKGSLKPERLTRTQAREAEAHDSAGDVDESTGNEPAQDEAPPDPRDFAEPVDIISQLPKGLQASLASSKWKDRKEALDEVLKVLTAAPRIQDGAEIGELARSFATRVQSDANINCVMTAASCMEALAQGIRAPFAKYRESVVAPMLERLKERKANVTDVIGAALDAVFATTTLADIVPDLLPALGSKNPQVKEGTLKFLGRCLATATTPLPPSQLKTLTDPLATLVEDGFEGARTEAAVCLGTLMKMVGERPLNALVEGLADVRKAKVKEAYEKATVKCKAGSGPTAKPSAPPPAVAPKKKAPAPEPEAAPAPPKKPVAKPPARLTAKKPAAADAPPSAPVVKKLPPSSAPSKPTKGGAAPAPGALDTFKYKHQPEDAESLAAELIPADIIADLADANWKTRLTALDNMNAWLDKEIEGVDAEVIVRALAKKGWAEKNFQVSAKIYGVFSALAERCPSFGRSCPAICVPHLSEKLGDMKLKKPAGDTLTVFAEKTSLQFVLNQAYDPLSKQKAPKVLADAITWVNAAITDFGIGGVSLKALIEFLKTSLQNSNAAVRTSATKALVTVKLFAGSSIKDLLEDLNPQLLNTIIGEFDKVEGKEAPEPTRTCADLINMGPSGGPSSGSGGNVGGDPLDDLFPRVEIDSLLKGTTILADAKSESWKTKKEALELLQALLDQGANKRLKPNMGEIGQILKSRVTDANKSVQTLALDIVCRIATGMGKPFEKQTRFFALPVATVLSDQKAPIRASAITTLNAIATACEGLESMVPGINTALESSNPLQKASLFQWIASWFQDHEASPSLDLSSWASAVVTCLDDRNSDVRKGAQAVLPPLIICAGFDHVLHQTNSLKPASRSSAVPLIQAARPAVVQQPVASSSKSSPISRPMSASPPPPSAPAAKANAVSKLTGVRRKLPQGSALPESRSATPVDQARLPTKGGVKKAGASIVKAQSAATVANNLPFVGMNMEAKKARLGKDANRWVNEGGSTRKDLAELLQSQMEPHASKELVARLFSHDHNAVNDYVQGLSTISDFFANAQEGDETMHAICLANVDLPLKYASIKAHEPQPNLISKCLEVVESVLAFLRTVNYQLTDAEALCFIPTMVHKLGDAREQMRLRVQQIFQTLPKVYAYSRLFQILLDYGLKSKVAKTRQGTLDELGGLLKRSGMGACEPSKAFPILASMIADKDSSVRKSALGALSEGYVLVGEKVWSWVGPLSPKDKTQLEERLRRVTGPAAAASKPENPPPHAAPISRIAGGIARPGSPARSIRSSSPSVNASPRLASPVRRSASPVPSHIARPQSPARTSRVPAIPASVSSSPSGLARPKTLLPSRLGRPRPNFSAPIPTQNDDALMDEPAPPNAYLPSSESLESVTSDADRTLIPHEDAPDDITITISSILSSDPTRSVDALKKIQKILSVGPEVGPSSPQYRELAEHTEGLIETITLQMAHVFDRPDDLVPDENFRLAKHLIQTLNNFCDHAFLAESLTVDILTSLLEELTLRLLETDDSTIKKVKDLSRFINMIILRLFATGRRMSIFRSLFALLLQIVKPFPVNGTSPDSKESKVAELVLKCVWKLARNIPQDLTEQNLDPVELFPAIEHFLQSVPPNEWRARATNKVPCGDMPLRTIKVIIQHVVAHHGDDVYDLLSASFDDPSATIVYPYVYRILNSSAKAAGDAPIRRMGAPTSRPLSSASSRPMSPAETASPPASVSHQHSSPSRRTSPSTSSLAGNPNEMYSPTAEEPDPDAQLLVIIGHISSETTGALHKEGITELHHFLKAHPHKKPRVDKMLDSTGAAFRKYIHRALATRAAEDQERDIAVADTLNKLEANHRDSPPASPAQLPRSPVPSSRDSTGTQDDKMSRLHNLFQYNRSSTLSNSSSHSRPTS